MSFDYDGTKWFVAGFEGGIAGEYHDVPWEFEGSTVRAGFLWKGDLSPCGPDRINCSIMHSHGGIDSFDIVFLSPGWFVAMKGGEPYRLGKRIV